LEQIIKRLCELGYLWVRQFHRECHLFTSWLKEHMMRLNLHLQFAGQCEAAFKFYETCLAGKITFMMRYAETPAANDVQPEWRDKIIHATIVVGNYMLQGSDVPPDQFQKPQGFSVNLNVDDLARAERIFTALAENGTVKVKLQETFWTQGFGMLTDRFEIPWMINVAKQT
jgi:PhnB protein